MPGTTEAIFRGPSEDFNGSNWNMTKLWGPKIYGLVEHDNIIHQPTANYVNLYGMENGLPLSEDETKSGFRKNFPFRNRDARFYHDIVLTDSIMSMQLFLKQTRNSCAIALCIRAEL